MQLPSLTTARTQAPCWPMPQRESAYSPAATMPVTLVMLEAIRDHFLATGVRIGMKPAGGIRTAKESLAYLVMLKETLGDAWLTPDLFRFGASSLATDLVNPITPCLAAV